jgi:hypothetical protein
VAEASRKCAPAVGRRGGSGDSLRAGPNPLLDQFATRANDAGHANRHLGALRAVVRAAQSAGLVESDWTEPLKRVPTEPRIRSLTTEDARRCFGVPMTCSDRIATRPTTWARGRRT